MSQDLMNYDQMTQLALRGVVRDAIRRVIREDGLPGAHHFYITFLTRFPGVDIEDSLAKKYTDEITIVLEHQYWDLKANDDTFEVTLKFSGVPKFLSVPYTAVTRFHDPSVGFALQFDPPAPAQGKGSSAPISRIAPASAEKRPSPALAPVKPASVKPAPIKPAAKPASKPAAAKTKDAPKDKSAKDDANDGSKVVSLDSFRKK